MMDNKSFRKFSLLLPSVLAGVFLFHFFGRPPAVGIESGGQHKRRAERQTLDQGSSHAARRRVSQTANLSGGLQPPALLSASSLKRTETPSGRRRLQLFVRDSISAEVLERALVCLSDESGEKAIRELTDSQGTAQIDADPGHYRLQVKLPGYAEVEFKTSIAPGLGAVVRNVALHPEQIVEGSVYNQTGQPLRGVTVTFAPRSLSSGLPTVASQSDARGEFEASLACTEYTVTAHGDDIQPLSRNFSASCHGHGKLELQAVQQSEWVNVSGLVLDEESKPVANAAIDLAPLPSDSGAPEGFWSSTTDRAGQFRLQVPPGVVGDLTIKARGYLPFQTVFDVVGGSEEPVFRMSRLQSFKVRVVDADGTLRKNSRVLAQSPDGSGLVLKRGEQPDDYCTSAYPFLLYAFDPELGLTESVLVESRQPEFEIGFERTNSLYGWVQGPDGMPLKDFTVAFMSPLRAISHRASEDGSFRFESLPAGEYRIQVGAEDCLSEPRTVRIKKGGRAIVRFQLKSSEARRRLVIE